MEHQLQQSADKFGAALSQLVRIADLNRAAAEACFELDQSDPELAFLTAEAVARGVSQLFLLQAPVLLYASALEMVAAGSGDLLEVEG